MKIKLRFTENPDSRPGVRRYGFQRQWKEDDKPYHATLFMVEAMAKKNAEPLFRKIETSLEAYDELIEFARNVKIVSKNKILINIAGSIIRKYEAE